MSDEITLEQKRINTENTFKEWWPILEMLDTKFNSIKWESDGIKINGVGYVDDIKIKVSLLSITYLKFNGLNLTFSIWDGKEYSESFNTIETTKAARIIGCVTNAIKDKIKEYNWDFLTIIAKDNIKSRMRLYTHISDRISRELLLNQINEIKNGAGVIVIGAKGIHIREIWDNMK